MRRKPDTILPPRPGQRVRDAITRATALIAGGASSRQAARQLGLGEQALAWYRYEYPGLWADALQANVLSIADLVRSRLGTQAAIADPDRHCRSMALVANLTGIQSPENEKDEADWTLCDFFEGYYRPRCMYAGTSSPGEANYRTVLRKWRLITGDPPLQQITSTLLLKFRDTLEASQGARPGLRMSPNTVRAYLRLVQAMLDKAGPSGPRNRGAAGLLKEPPWIRAPREVIRVRPIVPEEQLTAVYEAAGQETSPSIPGLPAALWWRALLAVTYNTGLRRGTMFKLRMKWIHWQRRMILIPSEAMKSGNDHLIHLNATAEWHLHSIRGDRELVFPWPGGDWNHAFHRCFHKLQNRAGIPPEEHFGLHGLRRALATGLWANSPQASQLALGHAGAAVTMRHYVQSEGIVAQALDALPQPLAFTARPAAAT